MGRPASEPRAGRPRAAGRAREADKTVPEMTAADAAAFAAKLGAATGGAAPHHAWRLMCEPADASGPRGDADEADEAGESRVLAAIEAALALAPRDPLETMLVAQMAAVHAAAMRALRRAAECGAHPQIEALYLRTASRLLHLFVRQSEALDRRARNLGRTRETSPCSCHAPPSAGLAPGARHWIGDPVPTAARGPGNDCCNLAAESEEAPDGAEILDRFVAGICADMREKQRADGASGYGGRESGPGGGSDP